MLKFKSLGGLKNRKPRLLVNLSKCRRLSQGLFENQNPNDERSSKPSSDIDFSYFYENGGINLDESIIEPEFVYLQKELPQLLKLNKEVMASSILKSSIEIPIAR